MKTKEIKTKIVIKASKEKVWKALTNFRDYPKWNPFIQTIEGDLKVGSKLKVKIVPPNSKGMTFKPNIIKLEEQKKLFWLGHLIIKGLFDGQHQFELIENKDGTTTLIQNEIFKGLLIPFFGEKFESSTRAGFNLMNSKLKEKIEIFDNL
ncbi:SRPBCC domain-containing protein [Brumimicrobium mesophilum]|uniref:SRPBCC domain-containing protein n=1 Tax=Brumimicrobium mesophilum TaxID=392717 RepID=UPI000D14308B|nr:SRPBCC domain-containing protein [Brumimicrobium mesophilum]